MMDLYDRMIKKEKKIKEGMEWKWIYMIRRKDSNDHKELFTRKLRENGR